MFTGFVSAKNGGLSLRYVHFFLGKYREIVFFYVSINRMTYKIDWHKQWQAHCPCFHEGKACINVRAYAPKAIRADTIQLAPGPGFGDFSHPTSQLVLKMMADHVQEKIVLDMGSGSGILSLVAIALGAKRVFGIDIDPEAVAHAKTNAQLNGFEKIVSFSTVKKRAPIAEILLQNMIISEQQIAIESVDTKALDACFTSGILIEQKDAYLELVRTWGFEAKHIESLDGWLGFYLKKPSI
jgi:ribosomal protein L11 methyltransferase